MSESTVTTRPAWVGELVTRFGEPAYEYPAADRLQLADRTRQCWAWPIHADGCRRTVRIDNMRGFFRTRVSSLGYGAELVAEHPPTDDEMRALCALAWPEAAGR